MQRRQIAAGREEQSGAIKGGSVPLDGSHDGPGAGGAHGIPNRPGFRARDVNGALEVPAEQPPPLRRAGSDSRAEVGAFGISAQESFGEHDQPRARAGRLADQAFSFFR